MTRDRKTLATASARAPSVLVTCEACDGLGGYEDRCECCEGFGWLAIEADEEIGVEAFILRDTRPVAEQKADWDDLRAMVASWRPQQKLDKAA